MKIFLNTCIIAMISAGIYGTVDVARDISHDTYIQYEEGENNVASNAVQQKSLSNVIRAAQHEVSTESEKKKTVKEPELNMEYFSRSGPVYSDERLFELTAATDTSIVASDWQKFALQKLLQALKLLLPKKILLLRKSGNSVLVYTQGAGPEK